MRQLHNDDVPRFLDHRTGLDDRVWRVAIAALTLLFGAVGLVMIVTPEGADGVLWRRVVMAAFAVSTVPVAYAIFSAALAPTWWSKRSRWNANNLYVVYADVGLTSVLVAFVDPKSSLMGCMLFVLIGAFVANFNSFRVVVCQIVFVTVVVVVFAVLLMRSGNSPLTSIAAVSVMMLAVNGSTLLTYRLTEILQQALRRQLVVTATDPLTGALNRRGFRFWGAALAEQQSRELLVAAIDVDSFKTINDRFGHDAGDQVLLRLTRVLTAGLSDDAVVGRLGGDEFAVVALDTPAAREFLTCGVHAVRVTLPDGAVVTVSVGLAAGPGGADTHEYARERVLRLHVRADAALRRSKDAGRGRSTVHDGAAA